MRKSGTLHRIFVTADPLSYELTTQLPNGLVLKPGENIFCTCRSCYM